MGRIVINETENKQTVILNDTPEGVSGGYFDQDMRWKSFGQSVDPGSYIPSEGGIVFTGQHVKQKAFYVTKDAEIIFTNNLYTDTTEYGARGLIPVENSNVNGSATITGSPSTMLELKAGDVVEVVFDIEKLEYEEAQEDNYFTVSFRNESTTLLQIASSKAESNINTIESDMTVDNIMFYFARAIKNARFKSYIYVNGERFL